MGVVEDALDGGTASDRVAFVSYTKRAAREARDRAADRFGFDGDDAPHFRTLHSMAFRALGLSVGSVMREEHWKELGELLGVRFTGRSCPEDGAAMSIGKGDRMAAMIDHARARTLSLEDAWRLNGGGVDLWRLRRFRETYEAYKRENGLWDFTDMVARYPVECDPVGVDVAIVDEAQDLTTLQWRMVEHAFSGADVWVAGDDDQSIYRWAGADVERFLSLEAEREVLTTSYRLPPQIHDEAARVIRRVSRRYAKDTRPTDRPGEVLWITRKSRPDLSEGTWLMLGRNRAHLGHFERIAREQGVVYHTMSGPSVDPEHVRAIRAWEALRRGVRVAGEAVNAALRLRSGALRVADEGVYGLSDLGLDGVPIWHEALDRIPLRDREYYIIALRGREKLDGPPRVRISTIHGAKGAEADNVLLRLDMSARTRKSYQRSPDDEHRVFYVGMTRARRRLFLVESWDQGAYRMPL